MIRLKIEIDNRRNASYREFYEKTQALPPGEYTLFVTDKKKSRSRKQQGYFFAVIIAIVSRECGYTREEANEIIKITYNPKEKVTHDGRVVIYGGSLQAESPKRCEEIFENIRRDFLEMDIFIPLPNELTDGMVIKMMDEGSI